MNHIVKLFGDVNDKWLKKVLKTPIEIGDEIHLIICSEGGDSDIALGIIDWLELAKKSCPVVTMAIGRCHSAAADILCFGSKGYRLATKNTSIMLHEQHTSLESKESNKHLKFLSFEKQRQDSLISQLAEYIEQPEEKLKNDIKDELWLTAEDAIRYKIIDQIVHFPNKKGV